MRMTFVLALCLLFATPAMAAGDKMSLSGVDVLQKGKVQTLVLHLSKADGSALTPADLQEVHDAKIHLLVIDQGMTDYVHVHPKAGTKPGEYLFSFTPKTELNYTVWADLTPVKGAHEYLSAPLQGDAACTAGCINIRPRLTGTAGGLKGVLSFDTPVLKLNTASMGTLTITDKKGRPVTDMQPVMGAFAHIVGFYSRKPGVVHLHPTGEEPKDDSARGGPTLTFHLQPEQLGLIELFAQVKRGGKDIYIPFTLDVKP